MHDDPNIRPGDEPASGISAALQKWGGITSFLLISGFVAAPLIYLVGNLRSPFGGLGYDLADLLYGPVWAASLITSISALRQRIRSQAQSRQSVALLAAVLAAGAMVLTALIRSANRHYHLAHPELHLEASSMVLTIWSTLIAGVSAAGWHFLGWSLILIGSAGWTSNRIPRALCILYFSAGAVGLFVYLFPVLEGFAATLGVIWAIWQGIILLKGEVKKTPATQEITSQQAGLN